MNSNRALMKNAITANSTLGTGGKLNPEQAKKFISYSGKIDEIIIDDP